MRLPRTPTPRARGRALVALATAVAALAGCSSSASPVSEPAAAPPAATVSIALSWTPNTDYTGLYVALEKGYYAAQGISVKVVPYASTAPETLVSHGVADFAYSYQAGVAYARSSGEDIVAVFAPDSKGTYGIGVAANRADITRPADLDGKTYAGFGTPDELPELRYVIRHDGGTGVFKDVTLNTSAYDAVYSGAADFTIPVVTWDAVQARLVGKPMKTFSFTRYGFPDQYSVLIASSHAFLAAHPALAKRFLYATWQGYSYAAGHPRQAAALVLAANPLTLPNPALVYDSEEMLASGGYLRNAAGQVGVQSSAVWSAYGGFLFANHLLTNAAGKVVTTPPDWSTYYTNAYLPAHP